MRILVTGGAGVIGKELVKLLIENNINVVVADLKPKPDSFGTNIVYRRGDLNNLTFLELEFFSPDIIFHLATNNNGFEENGIQFNECFDNNLKLSHKLIDLASKLNYKVKFIFASSYLVYDCSLYLSDKIVKPITLSEESQIRPKNLIGLSKYYIESELEYTNRVINSNLTYISVRIFRVFGKESKDIISSLIKSAILGEKIDVYNEYSKIDYISSESCAESLLSLSKSNYQGVVNLGSGYPNSIKDFLSILVKRFPDLNINFRKNDCTQEYFFSNNLLHDKIAKSSKINRFNEDVNKLIDFYLTKDTPHTVVYRGNVLVTSISNKVSIINNIRDQIYIFDHKPKLIGVDSNNDVLSKYFVDYFIKIPKYDLLDFEYLVNLLKIHQINYIIPTSDRDLVYFSKFKYALRALDIFVMVSDKESIEYTGNKLEFYRRFKEFSNLIGTYSEEDLFYLDFNKYVIKEKIGSGSVNVLLDLEKDEIYRVINRFKDPIIQRMIKGTELSIDFYVGYDSRIVHFVVRERVTVINGEAYYTRIYNDKIDTMKILTFIQKLNLYGQINIQMIIEEGTGIEYILEVNPRIGGASSLSTLNGLYSIEWFIKEANGFDFTHEDNNMNGPNAMRKYTSDYYEY